MLGLATFWPYATGIGILRQFEDLAGDQVARDVDDVAIELEDLPGTARIAQRVAGDRAERVITANTINRPVGGGRDARRAVARDSVPSSIASSSVGSAPVPALPIAR